MIFLHLPSEPAASERERFEGKGIAGFLISGEIHGKGLSAPLFSLSGFDKALESALFSSDKRESFLRLQPFVIDELLDHILEDRMRTAPTDSIKASYRVLLGRVGISFAKIVFRRLNTALNSARFAELKEMGVPAPRLLIDLVDAAPHGAKLTQRYLSECAHPDAAFLLSVRQLSMVAQRQASGPGLGDEFAEAKSKIDKLANYQIDLDRVAEDLERIG